MTFMCKPISEIKKYIGDDLKVYRRFEDITAIPNELALTDDSPLPILVLNDDFFDDDFKE